MSTIKVKRQGSATRGRDQCTLFETPENRQHAHQAQVAQGLFTARKECTRSSSLQYAGPPLPASLCSPRGQCSHMHPTGYRRTPTLAQWVLKYKKELGTCPRAIAAYRAKQFQKKFACARYRRNRVMCVACGLSSLHAMWFVCLLACFLLTTRFFLGTQMRCLAATGSFAH